MSNKFNPDQPFTAAQADKRGAVWQFAYWGSGNIYIRETFEYETHLIAIGNRASRDDWPYLIDLNYHGMRPDDVTTSWLEQRADEWITDRNTGIDVGLID